MAIIEKYDKKEMLFDKNVIGFADSYYTLWNIICYEYYKKVGENYIPAKREYSFVYYQNLAKDKDLAVKKFAIMFPNDKIEVDELVRGKRRSFNEVEKIDYPSNIMQGGKWDGIELKEIKDIEYLYWCYYNMDLTKERKDNIEKILLDAGFKMWENGDILREDDYNDRMEVKKNNDLLDSYKKGYIRENGEKINLKARVHDIWCYRGYLDSYMQKILLITEDNEIIYIDSSTDNREKYGLVKGMEIMVKGTLKHHSYVKINKETQMTKVLRAKIEVL